MNKEFADKTVAALQTLTKEDVETGTPLIWLHDYHLMLAANTIRNVSNLANLSPRQSVCEAKITLYTNSLVNFR